MIDQRVPIIQPTRNTTT